MFTKTDATCSSQPLDQKLKSIHSIANTLCHAVRKIGTLSCQFLRSHTEIENKATSNSLIIKIVFSTTCHQFCNSLCINTSLSSYLQVTCYGVTVSFGQVKYKKEICSYLSMGGSGPSSFSTTWEGIPILPVFLLCRSILFIIIQAWKKIRILDRYVKGA